MAITFGVTVLPDPPYTRFLELIELAEKQGFDYGWTYDSHVLGKESIRPLTVEAGRTSRVKPGTSDPHPRTAGQSASVMIAIPAVVPPPRRRKRAPSSRTSVSDGLWTATCGSACGMTMTNGLLQPGTSAGQANERAR